MTLTRPRDPITIPTPATRRWGAALAATALLACAAALGPTAPASAHTALVSSTPKQGQQVNQLPTTVTLTFTEEVEEPIYVSVTGPEGADLATGDPRREGATVEQDLSTPPDGQATPGTYTIAYRVVSDDGHPVSDELTFTLAEPDSSPSASATTSSSSPTASASDDPGTSASSSSAASTEEDAGFWADHVTHIIVGAALILIAVVLLVWSRRSKT